MRRGGRARLWCAGPALAVLSALAGCHASPGAAPSRFELVVLGIAQDGGLPHVGCRRACCEAARRSGRQLDPACLGIWDRETGRTLLVEATPGIERQLAHLERVTGRAQGPPVDAVLLTHAHIGHYLGLAHFGREVAGTQHLPVHASPRLAEFLRGSGPWSQLVALQQIELVPFAIGTPFEPIEGLHVTAIAVPHRDEYSDTVAFKIRGGERTALFVPDVDAWSKSPGLLDELLRDVDVAYIDATFYDGRELPGRDLSEIPHPPMVVTMDLLAEEARAHPGRFRFLHLNHTNPALHDPALRGAIEARGFAVAEVGERQRL